MSLTPDVILLQEHRYKSKDCKELTSQLEFLGGPSLWNEGSYSAASDKTRAGTAILLSKSLKELVVESGIIMAGRAQYVTIQLNPQLKLGILNIYAFNESRRRGRMWDMLARSDLPEAEWILGGDFNSVESLDNRIGGSCNTSMETPEMEAWTRLLLRFNLADSFHMPEFRRLTKKKFSWDNDRKNGERKASRIDKFYIPPAIKNIGGQIGILASYPKVSDHSPVTLKLIHNNSRPPRTVPFKPIPAKNPGG
ncbi:hypothetical protein M758_N019500 [Ceratodon purpureus]|nr:hypothetical protein M758_N019500 [Ceratodon purpureus]